VKRLFRIRPPAPQGGRKSDNVCSSFRGEGHITGGGTWTKYYYLSDGNGRQLAFTNAQGYDCTGGLCITGLYEQNGGRHAGGIDASNGFDNDRGGSSGAPRLSYYRSRYYDQETGRWTQEDPIGVAGGVNLYQYAGNNPIMFTDPFGLCVPVSVCPHLVWHGLRTAVGGAVAMYRAYQGLRASDPATRPEGTDRYYHCSGNCNAAQLGPAGATSAQVVSDVRELGNAASGGDSANSSAADQEANAAGRAAGAAGQNCERFCRTRYIRELKPKQEPRKDGLNK
jgi:RHS repeat-associated protein